jgi:predicted homoserine dehydrogenase-like protein
MNLQSLQAAHVKADMAARAGLIGAGRFDLTVLAQVSWFAGIEVAVIADLDCPKTACCGVGWDASRIARTQFCERDSAAYTDERVGVVVEATGSPAAGIPHAIEAGKLVVMINVEAAVLAHAWLAAE